MIGLKCTNNKNKSITKTINAENRSFKLEDSIQKTCSGNINFVGYANPPLNSGTKYFRFNCGEDTGCDTKTVYEIITKNWNFPKPGLIISIIGGFKRMNFRKNQYKKSFKEGLIEVMKKEATWIVGGGFHVGIHKLVGEAVGDYRLLHDSERKNVKLIGICTWGVVQNNHSLSGNQVEYKYSCEKEKGQVMLDPNYDGLLFCDDGTVKEYDKEICFRLNFEDYVRDNGKVFAVQILYEGGLRALEYTFNLLQKDFPLVVIKNSGRAADIICEVLNISKSDSDITTILNKYKRQLTLKDPDFQKYFHYLHGIFSKYKTQIVVHDILDSNMKLEKNILEAIISREKNKVLERILELTIHFNSYDIADVKIFQNPDFSFESGTMMKYFIEILKGNRFDFVEVFLENINNIEKAIDKHVITDLYQNSLSSVNCRCIDLIKDYFIGDLGFRIRRDNNRFIRVIHKIIHTLSSNVLGQKCSKNETYGIQALYLWSLLSGHFEMALIFWKMGKDHISSALIGAIILNNMRCLISKRGFSDLSEILSVVSQKFQNMAILIINEAYNENQQKAYSLLKRVLRRWDKITCMQLAMKGNLLDFLNQSPCRSHVRESWMGELSPFLPIWKVFLTIPFSFLLLKPLVTRSLSKKKICQNLEEEGDVTEEEMLPNSQGSEEMKSRCVYCKDLIKFYRTPIVKFIIYFISYIIFLFTFAYVNLTELKEIATENKMKAEIFVYVYVIAITAEEIRQVLTYEGTGVISKVKHYVSGSWNIYDMLVILLFFITMILRWSLPNNYFTIVRCFFAVIFSAFCLRSMQFYFIFPSIGPKVIMIRKMIVDILFFLSIFALFIISYGILAQSLLNPNSEWNLSLIKEIFHNPYFQMYGELLLGDFNVTSPCDHMCIVKYTTIVCGFAIYLLLTNILLINLLIAMFGHTFNKIQEESEKHFNFIQIQLLFEFQKKPLLPPPLNFIYFALECIKIVFSKIFSNETKRKESFISKDLMGEEDIQLNGFEHLCMESSVLKTHSVSNIRESQTVSPLDTMMELVEKFRNQSE